MSKQRKMAVLALGLMVGLFVFSGVAFAQEAAEAAAPTTLPDAIKACGLALGAGIAIAGAALATGRAQAAVGAGGTGALAEKPDLFTLILILIAIPETLVVFGFVISFLLYNKIV
ncbi:MAG: V-type ATP synthase subunit K [FCB group bacterium]|nr:V-type ATP synthase subunit K [FCB group bacterium]